MVSKKKNRVATAPAAVAPMPPAALNPPTLRALEAAEQFLTINPAVQQQILAAIDNAPAINRADSTQLPNAKMPEEWRRFERNMLAKSALVSSDAPKHHSAYDQRMQLHAGTVKIINLARDCLKDGDYDGVQITLDTLHRREVFNLTCHQHAGNAPGAGFQAAYELWHSKHDSFSSPDFDPTHLDKTATEAALSSLKQQRGAANNQNGAHWNGNRRSLERGRSLPPKHCRR